MVAQGISSPPRVTAVKFSLWVSHLPWSFQCSSGDQLLHLWSFAPWTAPPPGIITTNSSCPGEHGLCYETKLAADRALSKFRTRHAAEVWKSWRAPEAKEEVGSQESLWSIKSSKPDFHVRQKAEHSQSKKERNYYGVFFYPLYEGRWVPAWFHCTRKIVPKVWSVLQKLQKAYFPFPMPNWYSSQTIPYTMKWCCPDGSYLRYCNVEAVCCMLWGKDEDLVHTGEVLSCPQIMPTAFLASPVKKDEL